VLDLQRVWIVINNDSNTYGYVTANVARTGWTFVQDELQFFFLFKRYVKMSQSKNKTTLKVSEK